MKLPLLTATLPVAVAIVSALGVNRASALTKFDFNTFYDTDITREGIPGTNIFRATVKGTNQNPLYGLTDLLSRNYGQFNPQTQTITFKESADLLGVQGLQEFTDVLSGNGEDKLFGKSNATATIDNVNRTITREATFRLTGGAGRFAGATGTLRTSDVGTLDQDLSDLSKPIKSRTVFTGSFEVPEKVPESTPVTTLIGVGIGFGLLQMKRRRKPAVLTN